MPTILHPVLNLNKVATGIEIVVNYELDFTKLEKNLINLGMFFTADVVVLGVDPPRTVTTLKTLSFGNIPVTSGSPNPFPVTHKRVVTRALLDEDPTIVTPTTVTPDSDEIRCGIVISAKGLPDPVVRGFTNEVVLLEGLVVAAVA